MKPEDQEVKVETDYKMSRHFNGIVFSVITLMILIVLVLLFLFFKGRGKVTPPTRKATPSVVLRDSRRTPSGHNLRSANVPASGRHIAPRGATS